MPMEFAMAQALPVGGLMSNEDKPTPSTMAHVRKSVHSCWGRSPDGAAPLLEGEGAW